MHFSMLYVSSFAIFNNNCSPDDVCILLLVSIWHHGIFSRTSPNVVYCISNCLMVFSKDSSCRMFKVSVLLNFLLIVIYFLLHQTYLKIYYCLQWDEMGKFKCFALTFFIFLKKTSNL